MHIPASMLHGAVCPITAAVSTVGLGAAVYFAHKSDKKPSIDQFAAATSLIFALQMLNYPILNGTSGHLLGGVLAVSLLGTPFAVLSMAIVLTVQCIFFGDGGLNALGANILNMALIGTGIIGFAGKALERFSSYKFIKLFSLCWLSVMLAAFVCSLEVAIGGTVSLSKVVPAMLSTHALIGLGEGALTGLLVYGVFSSRWFLKMDEQVVAIATFVMAVVAASFSPFASNFPDGLEWVAEKLHFSSFSASSIQTLFPDYQIPGIVSVGLSSVLAGIIGIAIVFAVSTIIGRVVINSSSLIK